MTKAQRLIKKASQLPVKPGVYQFFDQEQKLLYIGKAVNLRARVCSYFRAGTNLANAKKIMVSKIADIIFTIVDTPTEALLLETTLIKKHKPFFNVVMKDDKNFQYIHITPDIYPRLVTVRKINHQKNAGKFFGPYTSGTAVWHTLRLLKNIFRYCDFPPTQKKGKIIFPQRPCLDYQLHKCVGPCAQAITARAYQLIFQQIERFLKGDFQPIYQHLKKQMQVASRKQQYEQAANLRNQLRAIESLMAEQKVVATNRENADYFSLSCNAFQAAVNLFSVRQGKIIKQDIFILQHTKNQTDQEIINSFCDQYYAQAPHRPIKKVLSTQIRRGRNRRLLAMGMANATVALQKYQLNLQKKERQAAQGLGELAQALNFPTANFHRIEIYDISHLAGKHSVGSMVVFENGLPQVTAYRKFKIKQNLGNNDFASLQEILKRRLQHLIKNDPLWPRPDLLIIDGGKGQLSSVRHVLKILKLNIPVLALAKKEEEIFVPAKTLSIILKKDSAGYYLIQRMRDEAHRFAIGFYRRQHLKNLTA